MFSRALLAIITSFLLALAPSAALAYDENDGDGVSTDNPNPAVGEVFGVSLEAGDCRVVRLSSDSPRSETTIDGKQTNSRTKPADDGEFTEFRVAIDVEGEFQLTGYCVSAGNEVLGVEQVIIGDGVPGDAAAETTQAGLLPDTGADGSSTALAVGGGVLLLAGAGILLLRRRKTTTA